MNILQRTYRVHDILELTEEEARDLYMELHKIFGETTTLSNPFEYPKSYPPYNPTPVPDYPFNTWVSGE